MLELLLWSYIAGLVGSIFMDITEVFMAKRGISSGVTIHDIGRWFLSMSKGTFLHKNIQTTKPITHEVNAGKFFHYIVAGGGIALLYPLFLYVFNIQFDVNHIGYAMIFGFLTNVFPWFWMMPSFGWGAFGMNKPIASNTILSPTISHLMYGFGMGVTLNLISFISNY